MSNSADEIVQVEKGFWSRSNDPAYFAANIADDAVTVIEPIGFIEKPMAVESAKGGKPFTDVQFKDIIVREIAPNVAMLVYHGQGVHVGGKPYYGSICSVYVKRDGRWQSVLTAHQPWKPEGAGPQPAS
jgi:hypothetical protein